MFAFRLQNFGSKDGTIFCGVFDGHGPQGHLVSKMVRDLLPVKLSANIARDEYKELSINTVTNGTTEGPRNLQSIENFILEGILCNGQGFEVT